MACGLLTTDRGLRNEYKTQTVTDCELKTAFRKVKLREMDSGLA